MGDSTENRLTIALCSLCLALALAGLWPRLVARRVAVVPEAAPITASIQGAVRDPGSYQLPWGARVGDLIDRAGGLLAVADAALVRPAAPLVEGASVFVPTVTTPAGETRISLNRATAEELQALPGIGPALAARIVRGRPYADVDALTAVRGIGPATLRRLRPLVTL